jgi:hypothetical protein
MLTPPNQLEKDNKEEKRLSKMKLKTKMTMFHKNTILLITIFSRLLVERAGGT